MYAIGIDDVRDMFGAEPGLAARLRTVASERFREPQEEHRSTSRLARLGPLFRRDPWAPYLDPDQPTPSDVELLVTGQFVPPERGPQAWLVVEAWLEELSFGHTTISCSDTDWSTAEFDLACAGLASPYALARLWAMDVGIPLRPIPGMQVGHCRHHHAVVTRDSLRHVSPSLTGTTAEIAGQVLHLLDGLDAWTAAAITSRRPVPDVVGVVRE